MQPHPADRKTPVVISAGASQSIRTARDSSHRALPCNLNALLTALSLKLAMIFVDQTQSELSHETNILYLRCMVFAQTLAHGITRYLAVYGNACDTADQRGYRN
jgi:hypothetical protein